MKIKATISEDVWPDLLDELNSRLTARRVYSEVIEKHLLSPGQIMGPAEWFVQETDLAIQAVQREYGCVVAMTAVSRNTRYRHDQMFFDGLEALEKIYREIIEENTPLGEKVQLFVAMMLDGVITIPGTSDQTNLLERKAIWVEGKKTPD